MNFLKRLFRRRDETLDLPSSAHIARREPPASADPARIVGTGDFRMVIEDAFAIQGRGVVVTGKVSHGTLTKGETVTISGGDKTLTTQVQEIEKFREMLDAAQAGDYVGLLLGQNITERGQVAAGMVVTNG